MVLTMSMFPACLILVDQHKLAIRSNCSLVKSSVHARFAFPCIPGDMHTARHNAVSNVRQPALKAHFDVYKPGYLLSRAEWRCPRLCARGDLRACFGCLPRGFHKVDLKPYALAVQFRFLYLSVMFNSQVMNQHRIDIACPIEGRIGDTL